MTRKVVIGLGFGDEGKGVVTDWLCSQSPENTAVVRFSGGHQCGHKVVRDGKEHIFSSFGAGTLLGCPTYWSEYCTVEPVALYNEYKVLTSKGVKFPKLIIHPSAPVTTIYDVYFSRTSSRERNHGTTGTGFFRTKKRHYDDKLKLTFLEFLCLPDEILIERIQKIREYYESPLLQTRSELMQIRSNIVSMFNNGSLTWARTIRYWLTCENLVFEGSQGLLLDQNLGYMPHCTPSDLTPRNILKMGYKIDEIFLVSRVYQTRHGNGPMTNEGFPIEITNNEKETNVFNEYQGEFRVSVLDLDQLLRVKTDGIDAVVPDNTRVSLVLTCADQVSTYQVTFGGQLFKFNHINELKKFVGRRLSINGDLYHNASPEGNLQK